MPAMQPNLGPSPGARKYPGHKITLRAAPGRCTVSLHGQPLAESRRALLMEEQGYPLTVYFPPDDVYMDRMIQSDSRSVCPFKGEARYFRVESECPIGSESKSDIAWCYPEVYEELAEIAGHVAFYRDRVEITMESWNGK